VAGEGGVVVGRGGTSGLTRGHVLQDLSVTRPTRQVAQCVCL